MGFLKFVDYYNFKQLSTQSSSKMHKYNRCYIRLTRSTYTDFRITGENTVSKPGTRISSCRKRARRRAIPTVIVGCGGGGGGREEGGGGGGGLLACNKKPIASDSPAAVSAEAAEPFLVHVGLELHQS